PEQVGPNPRRPPLGRPACSPPAQPRTLPGPLPDRLRAVPRHHLRRPHRPAGRNRPGLGPPLQRTRPRGHPLPPHRRASPPFTPQQAQQIVQQVETTDPAKEGLLGHNWTLKKLKQWVLRTFGRVVSRNALRRLLRQARLSWKKVKKLLGKANPEKRAAHI